MVRVSHYYLISIEQFSEPVTHIQSQTNKINMNVAIVLSIVAIVVSIVNSTNTNIGDQEWIKFKIEFNKIYKDEKEELFRKKVFLENLKLIIKHNDLYKKGLKPYELGINTYSDWTHQEFVARMNGFKRKNEKKIHGKSVRFSTSANVKVPDAIDYRTKGYVTPVKNQGLCASGWAFSAAGAIEGQTYRATKKLIPLSVQNLIDCSSSYGNNGCKGGTAEDAFRYVSAEGVGSESSYPYEAREGPCRRDLNHTAAVAAGRGLVVIPPDETVLKTAVGSLGPTSVVVDVTPDDLRWYKSGVYHSADCGSPASAGHAALVVGYGTDALGRDYWIVKNSWGAQWGDNGYALMARNKGNHCGIATSASVPLL